MKSSLSFAFLTLVLLGVTAQSACSSNPVVDAPADATADTATDSPVGDRDAAFGDDATPGLDASKRDTAPPPPPDELTAETLQVGTRTRSFGIRIPKTYDPQVAYPVVFLLHGNGGDGANLYSFFKFQSASGEKAILIYPDAENLDWDLYTPSATNKDVAFVEAMIANVASRYTVDTTRVFAWGWSNGAFFANQLACRRSALFRGIASHAGGAPYEPNDLNRKWPNGFQQCPGETAVPFIGFHGLADPVVDYPGGEFSATYWAYVNGCGPTRAPTTPALCEAYPGCAAGKPVVFCSIPAFGHGIWVNAATASWDFFQSL